MELEGLDVVKYLNGPDTVRDGSLVSWSVEHAATEPVIELVFEVVRGSGTRIVKIELRDIQEFDFGYTKENPQYVIEFLKAITTDEGHSICHSTPMTNGKILYHQMTARFFILVVSS